MPHERPCGNHNVKNYMLYKVNQVKTNCKITLSIYIYACQNFDDLEKAFKKKGQKSSLGMMD